MKNDMMMMGTGDTNETMANTTDNNGLLIAFLTDGMLNMTWMDRVQKEIPAGIPSGIFWKTAWVKGKHYREKGGYAKARIELVEKAMELKSKWIFFIDSDTFAPTDVITQMMARKKDIVTGIYYMKSQPPQPILYKRLGDGPYWDFPIDELFEVEAAGAGCMLINMKVFEAMKKAGIPYFKENWEYTKPDGTKVQVKVGEDYWFNFQAKKLGFTTWCDSKIICDHVDYNTGAIFPGEEEVQRIRKLSLEKHKDGKAILKNEDEMFKLPDSSKKTIVFNNAVGSEISGDEISKRPVGGAETAVIHIAKHLAKDFNVIVFGNVAKPGCYDGVRYFNMSDGEFLRKFKTDLLVMVRNTQMIANFNFKKEYDVDQIALWTHDIVESPAFEYLNEAAPYIDKIIVLSEWHKQNIMEKFPDINEDKFVIIRNAVTGGLFNPKILSTKMPPKMIYSSTPFRGLDVLLEVFPEIKDQVPDAELHVYSSLKVYGSEYAGTDNKFKHLYDIAKNTNGIFYHGSVLQEELSEAVRNSRLFAYPNHYPESSCISIMENVQAGVPVLTSRLAAIPETLPKRCGVLLHPPSTDVRYKDDFVKEAVSILTDESKYLTMRKECLRYKFSWADRAKEWKDLFFPGNSCIDTALGVAEIEARLKHREEHTKKQERAKENVTEVDHSKGSETIINPLTDNDSKLKQKQEAEDYKAKHGGNINTPEYWDNQYKFEHQQNIDQRTDLDRFIMITDSIKDGDSVCDFGCGLGHFLIHLSKVKPNCKLYGVDISEYALGVCKTQLPKSGLATDITSFFGMHTIKFDVIVQQHVIEHTDYPEKMIQLMKNHLTENGLLILVVPINDDEWIEHQKIYKINDVIELLNKFDCTYKLEHRVQTLRKKPSGSYVEELVAFVRFGCCR